MRVELLRVFSQADLYTIIDVMPDSRQRLGAKRVPLMPAAIERFGYARKHLVTAGITGWAQVNDLRGDSDIVKRIQYDLYYIDNWSLWSDLRILAVTAYHRLFSRNAH